jgi:hypothetical protein
MSETTTTKETIDNQEILVIEELFNDTITKINKITGELKSCNLSGSNRTILDDSKKKIKKSVFNLDFEIDKLYSESLKSQEKELSKKNKNKKSSNEIKEPNKNSAIRKEIDTEKCLLDFMDLKEGTKISRLSANNAVNTWINENYPKDSNNKRPDIIVKDNLKILFEKYKKIMISRRSIIEEQIKSSDSVPKKLQEDLNKINLCIEDINKDIIKHTDVMRFNSFGFPK